MYLIVISSSTIHPFNLIICPSSSTIRPFNLIICPSSSTIRPFNLIICPSSSTIHPFNLIIRPSSSTIHPFNLIICPLSSTIRPLFQDDEGREIAVKIDKQDRKHFNMETATKAYNEIRAEVAILKDLRHDYVIEFIGLTLQPLCFLLEWAPLGSLHNILTSYLKNEARLSPWTLVETARQVASGLGYLHSLNIVYYDLKSPNILAFEFPTADQSVQIAVGYSTVHPRKLPVRVKIADLGISRKNTPGGVVGYKGTPAFMAPEILKYVGMEACTEKVGVVSQLSWYYHMCHH